AVRQGGHGHRFRFRPLVVGAGVEFILHAAVVGIVAGGIALEEFGFQGQVGDAGHGAVGFLLPKGEAAAAEADDLVDIGRRGDRPVQALVLEDIQAAVVVVVGGDGESGGEAVGGDGGGE